MNLEGAILKGNRAFYLRTGKGLLCGAQKRSYLEVVDFYRSVCFSIERLKRPCAIELKLNKFKPLPTKEQDGVCILKWLTKNEKQKGKNAPIGLDTLC